MYISTIFRWTIHGGGLWGRDSGHHGARGLKQGGAHQGGLQSNRRTVWVNKYKYLARQKPKTYKFCEGVDETFESLLCAVFGDDLISSYKRKRSAGFIDLMIAFESRKRSANPNKMTSLNVALPFSFIDFYRKNVGSDVSLD